MAQPMSLVIPDLFWSKVDRSQGEVACWMWTGRTDRHGYGEWQRKIDGRNICWRAHRVAYELLMRPIPVGLVIDHLCRNRGCVNPAHMEPVTVRENTRRGNEARMYVKGCSGWCEARQGWASSARS